MAKRREEELPEYPAGFKQWAFWSIDLSINAPSLRKQMDALLPEWEKVRAKYPERFAPASPEA